MSSPFPILVINVSSEVARWRSICNQAISCGLSLQRVEAVESRFVPKEELEFVTPFVRALWKSHIKCLEQFLKSNYSHAIIAEDDFQIKSSKKLISTLQRSDIVAYDVVQLGWITPGLDNFLKRQYSNFEHWIFRIIYIVISKCRPSSTTLKRLRVKHSGLAPKGFVPDDFQPGTHFYLVSREFALAALKLNNPQFLAADDMYMALARMRSFKFIRVRKCLVSQEPIVKRKERRFLNH